MVNSNYQLNGKVFYRGTGLSGLSVNGKWISPEKMLMIYKKYERLLNEGREDVAEMVQEERGFPETWLYRAKNYFLQDTKYLKNKMNKS